MKLSVIIVNYNVKYYLAQCLHSLERALQGIEAEVIVVDNHSQDDSVKELTPLFPKVRFIANQHNVGFARGNNKAIENSKGEYVLLLNPDTIVGEQTIARAVNFLEMHPEAGAIGVKMLNADGSKAMESRRGIPTPMTAFYKFTGFCKRFPNNPRFARYYMSYLSWDEPHKIDIVSGAFFMVPRKALDKVGLLDEDFFMYGEDIDLGYRLLKAGYRNWYLPQEILHYKGESTKKSSFRYVHVFYEAMYIFFRKHFSSVSFWISIPVHVAIIGKALLTLLQNSYRGLFKSLGFFRRHRQSEPRYYFFCSHDHVDECKSIAAHYGLSAEFFEGNEDTIPQGHHGRIHVDEKTTAYMVYDVEAYDYRHMFAIMQIRPKENVLLATYHPKHYIVITPKEILR